jgi:hypothetical protein
MIATKLLLQSKIKNLPKKDKREFLINCINKNNILKFDELPDTVQIKDIKINNEYFCKICDSNDFIKNKFEEICEKCGFVRPLQPSQKNYEKIEYIKPGSNIVKITKDSKKITVDLNKINLWLQDTDPLYKDTKKIIENLETIFQTKSLELPQSVQNTAISLWYNFNNLYEDYNSPLKKLYNKKAIISLCIFYGALINGYNISLQQLSILIEVNISEIIATNNLFRDIFKETEYYKYLTLSENKDCEIKISTKNKLIFEKIKKDLIENFSNINNPLSNKEYAGIIYYITNKINPIIKFTLKELENKCNVSTTSISSIAKSIDKFYKSNPKLYKELLI